MRKNIGQIGEKSLLQRLKAHLGSSPDIIRTFSEDCAVIDFPGDYYHLFTVDAIVEGTHFRSDYATPYEIGRKGIKVNLSDIAAMAGEPMYFLVSLGAPSDVPIATIDQIYEGIASVSRDSTALLIGGNVCTAPVLFLDITVIGRVRKKTIVLRSGAEVGDAIFVTGPLGGSAEGLKLLQEGHRLPSEDVYLRECIAAHLDPPYLVSFARSIATGADVHAMIDLSDGIASDLPEICRESRVGARLNLQKIPIAPAVAYWEEKRNGDPLQVALTGGEDYHLLFTAPFESRSNLHSIASEHRVKLSEIGEIVDVSRGIRCIDASGRESEFSKGFEHFQ